MRGKGTAKKNKATKAAAATTTASLDFRARRPTRNTASITTASTAALRPKNSPATKPPAKRDVDLPHGLHHYEDTKCGFGVEEEDMAAAGMS
jgi:hypothetical protein